jgi:hypothetical protein
MPAKDPEDQEEAAKPSQAEGERNQPGEVNDEKEKEEKEFVEPSKPSQAEGERKPYT